MQDTELAEQPDATLLEWAARHQRIVLSRHVNTMRGYFYERVRHNLPVPGLFLVPGTKPTAEIIELLELRLLASNDGEWVGELYYLPL